MIHKEPHWDRDPSDILQGPDGCFEWSDGDVWQRDGEMEETYCNVEGNTRLAGSKQREKAVDHMKRKNENP